MPSQEPIHLFVYWTLTDSEHVTALTGRQFERLDATLSGFQRVNSPLGYPFIFPQPGATVRGVLLFDVDLVSLAHLDSYEAEGDLYRRQVVVVEVADRRVAAMTYVGHSIRASVAPLSGRWTDPSQPEVLSDTRAPVRRQRAPFADEH
jgi:gamma-glutamylcyclotransferase (GGCT)/AIG2-like uncharacterized protein YtfP